MIPTKADTPPMPERTRSERKIDHLRTAALLGDGPGSSWFECVQFVHNCMPGLDPDDLDLQVSVAGIRLHAPLIINAITGGTPAAREINRNLASVARRLGLAMAVGSQRAALEDQALEDTFSVVRAELGDGVIFANVGLEVTAQQARRAVSMIGADALQIHLNVAQELAMAEGERRFTRPYERLAGIVQGAGVPVIAKEVGFGVAAREAERMAAAGAAAIDTGGRGGTNFLAIEFRHNPDARIDGWETWGIPTSASIVECAHGYSPAVPVIATGGIRSGLDAARALALGATAVGIAGPLIRILSERDVDEAEAYCSRLMDELKTIMLLVGARTPAQFADAGLVLLSPLRCWLELRGLNPAAFARR